MPYPRSGAISHAPLRREVDLCDYELVSVMPSNGLLWQVAYDRSLSCAGVQPALFQAFVSTLRRGLLGYDTWPPVGVDAPARACIINRNDSRAIRNAHVIDAELRRLCIGAQRRRVMTTHLELTASQTLREQALMLEPCDLLIGAHGAGLTNALFMRPGSALVEFSSTANKNYRTLAHLLGHSYFARRVACEAPWACVGQATVISPHDARPQSAAGFVLEAAAVREVLSAALAAAAQSGGRDETEMVSSTCGGLEVSQDGPVGGRPYKLPKVKLGVKLQNVSPAREAEHTYSTASISHRKELHRAAPSQISSAAAKAFWAKPVWDSSQQSEERNQYPPPKIKVDINGRSVVAHPKVKPPKTAKVKPPKPTSSGEASHLSGGGRFPFSPDGFACSDQVYQVRVLRCSSIGGKGVVVVVVCSGLRSRFLVSASVHSSPLIMWLHNALYVVWLLSGNVMTDQATTLDRAAFQRDEIHPPTLPEAQCLILLTAAGRCPRRRVLPLLPSPRAGCPLSLSPPLAARRAAADHVICAHLVIVRVAVAAATGQSSDLEWCTAGTKGGGSAVSQVLGGKAGRPIRVPQALGRGWSSFAPPPLPALGARCGSSGLGRTQFGTPAAPEMVLNSLLPTRHWCTLAKADRRKRSGLRMHATDAG